MKRIVRSAKTDASIRAEEYFVFTDESNRVSEFTGKSLDAETGLDYFGARYFSGASGAIN
ncbi:MAG: hypothetical protein ABI693_32795 [Bryobacteraceae bacterium]